ncbi:MAG: TrkH family potassium uptake protein [Lachnospiraceae bacterium]|jgi:trk system potassium uptake protein TrkH|nr:TrkH family potassium uptake protein [Lachnospiraceae bacterium]
MNYSIIRYILCRVLEVEGIFLALPCITAVIYGEKSGWAFAAAMLLCLCAGFAGTRKKPKSQVFYAREGFVTVSLSWIVLSLAGALPFTLCGEIPSYTDALFEVISGFTTTGASILSAVEPLSRCCLFWRSFTHWLGGMGVLVFVMAVLPLSGGYNMHLMRAESPGPSVGKLVPRVKHTAQILYGIYLAMTLVQVILLLLSGLPLFDSLTMTFGTAGTGGFGILNDSAASYTALQQGILTVFMILFGVNFNVYYLFLIRKPGQALKCEEMRAYLGIIAMAVLLIVWNARDSFATIAEAFRHSAFQVASIITTTGFSTVDFDQWPQLSKCILVLLMFVGACAGSTGGGIKVSRCVALLKSVCNELRCAMHPRSVRRVRFEGRPMDQDVVHSIERFFAAYMIVFAVSVLVIALENMDFVSTFTAVAATLNNIGPGLGAVGPMANFGGLSVLSKYVLMFDMLAGRLEIFPMLVLFMPMTWRK